VRTVSLGCFESESWDAQRENVSGVRMPMEVARSTLNCLDAICAIIASDYEVSVAIDP
jgi:hypothetical protein